MSTTPTRVTDGIDRTESEHGRSGSLHIAVTGATGTIGSALAASFATRGHTVVPLVRGERQSDADVRWDPAAGEIDTTGLEGLDAVVHLSGRRIDRRFNRKRRDEIVASRVDSTRVLAQALAGLDRPPRALVSASAVGYYGSRGDEILTDASSAGTGFLAELCGAWESATAPAADAGIRVVNARFGVVLTKGATPLSRLLLPFRLGLGATIGSGRQFMSWVHLDDAVAALTRLVADERLEGPVNVTSPSPVTNREFTKTLGRALGRSAWLRAPAWAISSAFGEMGRETVLASQRAVPEKLTGAGFAFAYADLEAALEHELGARSAVSEALLRIGEVARRANVPVELLRAWERRYGVVRPGRTDGGFRLYTEDDVQRVVTMRSHIGKGLAASEAAKLALAEGASVNGASPPVTTSSRELQEALDRFDDVAAQAVLDRLLSTVTLDVALRDVVIPYLRGVGERWRSGELSIAQEHFASSVVRGRLLSLARGWDRGSGPRAVLACAPGDQHDLPLLMLGLSLRSHGWRISYLGADTPLDSLLEAVDELRPALAVVSGTPTDAFEGCENGLSKIAALADLAIAGGGATEEVARASGARLLEGDPVSAAATLAS